MIKNVFIPENIGSYYIFPKRILGVDIGKTSINVTQLLLKGTSVIIEKYFEEKLEPGNSTTYNERVVTALQAALRHVDPYDAVNVALVSSVVIFKELRLPFVDHAKIAMVIEFEVEPLLPFATSDAIIDFIVTKQLPEEKSAEVLVAAVPKSNITHMLELCAAAGINPSIITVDMFALYGLYLRIPSYAQLTGSVVLIDFGSQSTRIAYIYNGQLRLIRTLPKTIFTATKQISEMLSMTANESLELFMRYGLEKNAPKEFSQACLKALGQFWQEIAFTLQSFTSQSETQAINTILICGKGAEIKGLTEFIAAQSGSECSLFAAQKIVENPTVRSDVKNGIPSTGTISLATACAQLTFDTFNLRKKEFTVASSATIMRNQIIAACVLIGITFCSLGTHMFIQLAKLKREQHHAQEEAMTVLKETFKNLPQDTEDLDELLQSAENEIKKENQLWFSFSPMARTAFLRYLLELTSKIDKEGLGFSIEKLHMNDTMITMTAQVKDHDALIALEKELRQSKLFSAIGGDLFEPHFTMKIRVAKPR